MGLEQILFSEVLHTGVDNKLELVVVAFAHDEEDRRACWTEKKKRRPTLDVQSGPHRVIQVVHDGMLDLMSYNRILDIFARFLVRELGRMAADDDEAVAGCKPFLETMELRQNMKTIYATIREEVDQDQ